VPRQRGAPAFPEQLEPVVEQQQGLVNPVGIGAARGELDRKRYSVKPAADFGNDGRVGVVQFKPPSAGDRALDEQLHGREAECLGRRQAGILGWTSQRQQAMNMFAFDTQRLAAGRQNMHLRRILEDALGQRRRGVDHMLAAIEDQQHPPVAKQGNQARGRIAGLNRQSERGGDRTRHQKRIVDRPEIEKMNSADKLRQQFVAHRDGDRGLADATRAHDGDEAFALQLIRYLANGLVTPHYSGQAGRQVAGLIGHWPLRNGSAWRIRTRDWRDEAVSLPRQRRHISAAQRLAKRGDMDSQAAFIDREARPDPRHQIVFADDLARLFGQDDENVERTRAEMKRDPFPFDQPLRREQAESNDVTRDGAGSARILARSALLGCG